MWQGGMKLVQYCFWVATLQAARLRFCVERPSSSAPRVLSKFQFYSNSLTRFLLRKLKHCGAIDRSCYSHPVTPCLPIRTTQQTKTSLTNFRLSSWWRRGAANLNSCAHCFCSRMLSSSSGGGGGYCCKHRPKRSGGGLQFVQASNMIKKGKELLHMHQIKQL
jgi:hypothetical protein